VKGWSAIFLQFPNRPPPCKKTIRYNIKKYHRHGTSSNRNEYNSGRHTEQRGLRIILIWYKMSSEKILKCL